MIRRTTVDLDTDLVARAKRALQIRTTRAVIEEALRRAASSAESDLDERRGRQVGFFATAGERLDTEVLSSDEMWR